MTEWSHGYTTDIEYTTGFYRELAPSTLQLALLLKGIRPPSLSSFSYCELGFGQGLSLNILAAAHPNGDFWGTDFNPSHAANARNLADSAGLSNLHVFDQSFDQFLEADLPAFDFICLHGIYSWISPENRQKIVQFIDRRLKFGGVVYVSYNCLPGWAAAIPMRQLLAEHAARSSSPAVTRVANALDFADALKEAGASYFTQNPTVVSRLAGMKKMAPSYIAHEYMNKSWHPQYFSEVAGEMAEAKLSFAASASLTDHLDLVNFSATGAAFLATISDPTLRETTRDYLINQQFRRDIFVKGPTRLTPREQAECLGTLRLSLVTPRANIPTKASLPIGEVTFNAEQYGPILDLLAQGMRSVDSLTRHLESHGVTRGQIIQVLIVLVGLGHVATAIEPDAAAMNSTGNLNRAIITRSRLGHEEIFLASPVIRSGVEVDRMEQFFLAARGEGADPAVYTWGILQSLGQRLLKDGKPLEAAEENLAELRIRVSLFEERLPRLQALGIA